MKKYSFELKMKVIEAYLNGEGGAGTLARRFHVQSKSYLKRWLLAYQAGGAGALRDSGKTRKYSSDFKLRAVKLYTEGNISHERLAFDLGIKSPESLRKWISLYRRFGACAFSPVRRKRKMPKKKKVFSDYNDTAAIKEYLAQLEKENERLRMENAFLKEMRRLREEENRRRGRHGPFTVSEENSD